MELVDREDIPRASHGPAYPWDEWGAKLKNGKALKLGRDDMPKDSHAQRAWGERNRRGVSIRSSAKAQGILLACRGDYIYLWRK